MAILKPLGVTFIHPPKAYPTGWRAAHSQTRTSLQTSRTTLNQGIPDLYNGPWFPGVPPMDVWPRLIFKAIANAWPLLTPFELPTWVNGAALLGNIENFDGTLKPFTPFELFIALNKINSWMNNYPQPPFFFYGPNAGDSVWGNNTPQPAAPIVTGVSLTSSATLTATIAFTPPGFPNFFNFYITNPAAKKSTRQQLAQIAVALATGPNPETVSISLMPQIASLPAGRSCLFAVRNCLFGGNIASRAAIQKITIS